MKIKQGLFGRFDSSDFTGKVQIRSFSNINQNPRSNFYFGLVTVNILALGFIFGFLNPGDLDTDGGNFAAIAFKDMNGGTLYIDTWDNKPPGIFYLMEIFFILIPSEVNALYALSVTSILALVTGLYLTAYHLLRSMFLSILVLTSFILIAVNGYFMNDGLYTEISGSVFIIWSLYYYSLFCNGNKVKHVLFRPSWPVLLFGSKSHLYF